MKTRELLKPLWLVIAAALVLYSNSGYRDAALVGNLWLLVWTFPVGPALFVAQLYGLPPLSSVVPHIIEQVATVVLAYAFLFWMVPVMRSRLLKKTNAERGSRMRS